MWKRAEEVPKADADKILERWDLTDPALQRQIVLQNFLDLENGRLRIRELISMCEAVHHAVACHPEPVWMKPPYVAYALHETASERIASVICKIRGHDFESKKQGGDPAEASSQDIVRVCRTCGEEA